MRISDRILAVWNLKAKKEEYIYLYFLEEENTNLGYGALRISFWPYFLQAWPSSLVDETIIHDSEFFLQIKQHKTIQIKQ